MSRWFQIPEVAVAAVSFVLHLVWEFAQVPLFADMPSLGHWHAIQVCASATAGDAVIALIAFWGVALVAGPALDLEALSCPAPWVPFHRHPNHGRHGMAFHAGPA